MPRTKPLRTALATAAAAVTLASAPLSAADAPAPLPFTLKQVGPGVYAAIDGPKGKSGSNAGFVIGDDGVLVIDSFFHPDATKRLVEQIRKLTPKPIRYVVDTHYHIDHVGGDAVLRQAGATIIAHRNERAWVRTDNQHLLGDRLTPALKATIEKLPLPDITTRHRMTVWLGSRKVVIEPALGHTGGDLMVSVPDANVLFCGDILWNHVSPNIIDGNVTDWIATTDRLRTAPDAGTITFVPGHGDIATASDIAAFEGYLTDLKTLVGRERSAGLSGQALVDAAMPAFRKKYADWPAFSYFAPLQLKFMDQELSGTKRVPKPVPAGPAD
ncbi:MBL fold metallo-hydrolase [Stakelama marina]|uniref:MBL fold metallo-hydrolase n=1 Tax=Stakelama marina TaxID=2826939 RepID=A0A8T4I8W5_9SPHN|nr:MBL fold metallo-hydrolase [Stakelama marina]MBR0551097.1 MBL fold metallo-hydrolase [Stakelama marina]